MIDSWVAVHRSHTACASVSFRDVQMLRGSPATRCAMRRRPNAPARRACARELPRGGPGRCRPLHQLGSAPTSLPAAPASERVPRACGRWARTHPVTRVCWVLPSVPVTSSARASNDRRHALHRQQALRELKYHLLNLT